MCEGVRRRGLVGLVRPALTGRHRQSLELPCRRQRPRWCALRRRRAAFYAPCRSAPARTGPPHRHSLLAGLVGEVVSRALSGKLSGVRRRCLEDWPCTAPGAHHRRSLGDAVSAAAAAGVGDAVAATPPFTLPAGGGHRVPSGGSRLSCSQAGGVRGVRRRGLEDWLRTAPGAHHRRSLGDAVSAAAAAGVGHCCRRHATLYAPRRRRSPGAVRRQPTLVLAGWGGGRWMPDARSGLGHAGGPAPGVWARGVGRGRYSSGGCVVRSRVTSVVPRWSRRNW